MTAAQFRLGDLLVLSWFNTQPRFLIAAIVSVSCTFVGCQSDSGPTRHSVKGVVSVDGVLAEGMLVQLQRQDAGTGNDQYPSCISDAQGRFQFGGTSSSPGLIAGSYVATFAWLEGKDLEAKDKLQGKLSDPKKSNFRITVPSDELNDIKFELKRPK
jgi:hypothetical protein